MFKWKIGRGIQVGFPIIQIFQEILGFRSKHMKKFCTSFNRKTRPNGADAERKLSHKKQAFEGMNQLIAH